MNRDTLDLSHVPHLEERKALLERLEKRRQLVVARQEISAPFEERRRPHADAWFATASALAETRDAAIMAANKALEAARVAYNTALGLAHSVYDEAFRAAFAAHQNQDRPIDEEQEAATADIDAAIEAFDEELSTELGGEHPWTMEWDDDAPAELCMLSGLPIHDDDLCLADDDDTGGRIIRAVLFAPEPVSEAAEAIADQLSDSEAA